jgi:hypothetical protein
MPVIGDAATLAQRAKPAPALKLNFLSHGTLESRDLTFSRRFYEEFLGLEVIQTSPISLLIRLGGPNTIAVVYSKNVGGMNLLNHNGLDVRTQEEVDEAHRICSAWAQTQWHLKKISKPHLQHGTYSFYFWDGDVGLAFLSPQLVEAILQGRQPVALTATRLTELDLPLDWTGQHKLLAG